MVCTSCFEESMQWHRAVIMKIIDDSFVKVNTVLFKTLIVLKLQFFQLISTLNFKTEFNYNYYTNNL